MQILGIGKNQKRNLLAIGPLLLIFVGLGGCSAYTAKPNAENGSASANETTNASPKGTPAPATTPPTTQLTASPSSLNFGNVEVGNATSQLISLTNAGTTSVTIGNISVSSGFGANAASNVTLMPNQSVSLYVSFTPTAVGNVSGTLAVASTASNSMLQIPLAGSGSTVQPNEHAVALNWNGSASSVVGYNVYRASVSGGPYAKVNSSMDPDPAYTDAGVTNGGTYYYVVTSVDSSNVESGYSNQVAISVP